MTGTESVGMKNAGVPNVTKCKVLNVRQNSTAN